MITNSFMDQKLDQEEDSSENVRVMVRCRPLNESMNEVNANIRVSHKRQRL